MSICVHACPCVSCVSCVSLRVAPQHTPSSPTHHWGGLILVGLCAHECARHLPYACSLSSSHQVTTASFTDEELRFREALVSPHRSHRQQEPSWPFSRHRWPAWWPLSASFPGGTSRSPGEVVQLGVVGVPRGQGRASLGAQWPCAGRGVAPEAHFP